MRRLDSFRASSCEHIATSDGFGPGFLRLFLRELMISRNKREGRYCGAWGGAHARSRERVLNVSSSAAKLRIAMQVLGPGARFLEVFAETRNACGICTAPVSNNLARNSSGDGSYAEM